MEISLTQLQFDRIIELLSKDKTAFCQGLKNNLLEQTEPPQKLFFWKDKSGRGFARSFQLQDLLIFQDEQNWDGDDLKTWAQDAEEGDTFENAANLITCTRS